MPSNPYSSLYDQNPYTEAGSLGGTGLEDLYSTYSEYASLMGGETDFEYLGQTFGLDIYDQTQENILREKFREDYRDFTGTIADIYETGKTARREQESKIGKSGFAGSGMGMSSFQSSIADQMKNLKESFKATRLDLLDDISGLRSDYQEDVYDVYETYLAAYPEYDHEQSALISDCYNEGKEWVDGECIEMGELSDDWTLENEVYGDPPPGAGLGPLECQELAGWSYDYQKGECTQGGITQDDIPGNPDDDIAECQAIGGQWDYGSGGGCITMEEQGIDLNNPQFEVDGTAYDIQCPSGMEYGQDGSGYWGCIDPNYEGHFLGNTYWTEQGSYGSGVDEAEYQWWLDQGETFIDDPGAPLGSTYEDFFGSPHPDLGYTAYYCDMHPFNPNCQ